MSKRIGLYLMGTRGVFVLSSVIDRLGASAVAFVTAGRDAGVDRDRFDDIRLLAENNGIAFRSREDLGGNAEPRAAIAFAVGWRWLLHGERNLVVLHDSLLPRYRGFAPLVNSLIAGERRLGVTALRAADDYDTGPVIAQTAVDVRYPLKIADAIDRLCPVYADLVTTIAQQHRDSGQLDATPQDNASASYSPWRDALDYRIPWSESAAYIRRFCDAVGSPYAGALTYWGDRAIRVVDVEEAGDADIVDRDRHVGKVIARRDDAPVVICGTGLLRIDSARFEDSGTPIAGELPFRVRFTVSPPGEGPA